MRIWISASLLQSLVSHDPSEIILICWFAAQETLLNSFVEYATHFLGFVDEQNVQKNIIYLE